MSIQRIPALSRPFLRPIRFLLITLLGMVVSFKQTLAFPLMATLTAESLLNGVLSTLIYSLIGIVMAVLAYKVVDWLIPGHISRQLVEDKNLPIGLVVAAMILGICIIIAAAIAG